MVLGHTTWCTNCIRLTARSIDGWKQRNLNIFHRKRRRIESNRFSRKAQPLSKSPNSALYFANRRSVLSWSSLFLLIFTLNSNFCDSIFTSFMAGNCSRIPLHLLLSLLHLYIGAEHQRLWFALRSFCSSACVSSLAIMVFNRSLPAYNIIIDHVLLH